MSDTPDGGQGPEPGATDLGLVFSASGSPRLGSRSGVWRLVILALGVGVVFLGWRIYWEMNHPAARLARRVNEGDTSARIAVIHQLANVGKEDALVAIPALVACLGDPDAEVRAAAAMGLVAVTQAVGPAESTRDEVRDVVRALIGSLKDSQPAVRAEAAQALWSVVLTSTGSVVVVDRAQVLDALINAAGDPDAGVRLSALRGLGAIGPSVSDDPPPILIAAIEDASDQIRAAAAYAIVQYRRGLFRLIPALVQSMESAGPEARARYVEILGAIRPPQFSAEAVPSLVAALDSSDGEVRFLAASSLATFKKDARSAIPALIKCLADRRDTRPAALGASQPSSNDPVVAAAETLGQVAPPTEKACEVISALAKVLKSGSARQRAVAATALGQFPIEAFAHMGPGRRGEVHADPVQLAALTEAVGDADAPVRVASLRALHDVGMKTVFEASPELNAALATAMEDQSPAVRTQAAGAIAHSGLVIDRLFPAVVRHAAHDPDKEVREMCAAVVSLDSGPVPARVTAAMIPVLIEALASREQQLRQSACHSLARFGPKAAGAIAELQKLEAEPNPKLSEAARKALRAIAASP